MVPVQIKRFATDRSGAVDGGLYVDGKACFSGRPPRVSALIYCRNSGKTLPRAIESILDQDYHEIEILIADGKSVDNTIEILREYNDKIHYWRSEEDSCASEGQNKVMSWISGEFFFFVNADDWVDRKFVSSALRVLDHKESDFVFGDCTLYRGRLIDKISKGKANYDKYIYRYHSIPTVSVFYRRRFYEICGPVDCCYQTASDYEWFLRATRRGLKGSYDPSLHVYMTLGGRSAPSHWRDAWALLLRAEEWQIQVLYGVAPWRASLNYGLEAARRVVSHLLIHLGLSGLRNWLPAGIRR
jgi:glycosyltransferase involved in cell wall biosynthesis